MRTVYAVQFTIEPRNAEAPEATMERIRSHLGGWIRSRYKRNWDLDCSVPFDGSTVEPSTAHRVYSASKTAGSEHELDTLEWSHPGSDDSTLLWTTHCTVARKGPLIELSATVRITLRGGQIRPIPHYDVGRPGLVSSILRYETCRVGGQIIPWRPETVGVGEVDGLVSELTAADRYLPIVVLSVDAWAEEPFTDPERLADRLVGLARVVVVGKQASFELTDLVGKRLSCFNGAIRIYWPGFDPRTESQYHPLFLPERMRQHMVRGRPIERHLFRRFSTLAITWHTEGDVAREVRERLEGARRAELSSLREELETRGQDEEELDRLELQILQLLEEQDELVEENRALRDDLAAAHKNIQEVSQRYAEVSLETDDYAEAAAELIAASSVMDAVHRAAELHSDDIEIWPTAEESAKGSDFARPEEVLEALEALAELGVAVREARHGGQPTGPWRGFFDARGIKYSANESESTLNQYGASREFSHEGRQLQMVKHLTIGGGSRRDCVQIFFEFDERTEKMLIGYCGRHLPYSGQRT